MTPTTNDQPQAVASPEAKGGSSAPHGSAFLRWYNSSAWAGAGKDAGELAAAAWNAAMLHAKAKGSAS